MERALDRIDTFYTIARRAAREEADKEEDKNLSANNKTARERRRARGRERNGRSIDRRCIADARADGEGLLIPVSHSARYQLGPAGGPN